MQEKYLENKIKEGTEKLKSTLKKIKDDMEKYSIKQNVDVSPAQDNNESALSSFHHHKYGNDKVKSKNGNYSKFKNEEKSTATTAKNNEYSNIISPQSTDKLINVNVNSTENLNSNNKGQNLMMNSQNSLSRNGPNNNEDSDNEYNNIDKRLLNQKSDENLNENTNQMYNFDKSGTFKTDINNQSNKIDSGSNFFDRKLGRSNENTENDYENDNTKNYNYNEQSNSNEKNKNSTSKSKESEQNNRLRMSSDFNNENEERMNYINNNNTFKNSKYNENNENYIKSSNVAIPEETENLKTLSKNKSSASKEANKVDKKILR